jgi:hypothetical protein
MSVIDVFPRRPLQLTAFYRRPTRWSLIVSCVVIGVMVFVVYSATLSLVDDYRLRAVGTVARHSSLNNGECHMWLVNECEFDAHYVVQDGSSHTRHVELLTVFQQPDEESRFIVRYDAARPEHISTTWGSRLMLNRTITLVVSIVLLLSLIPYAISLVIHPKRLRSKLAAIGAQPTPMEVNFVKVNANPSSPSATIFYSWIDFSGRVLKSSTEFQGTQEPFWLDAAKTKMLALLGADGQAHLLDAALASVTLTEQERARVIEARDRALNPSIASGRDLRTRA